MSSDAWYSVLIAVIGLERLAELMISKRNMAWSLQQGGREFGFSHFPFMVALHSGLLVGCLAEVWIADRPFTPALGWPMLVVVLGSQGLRWWCIQTLGHQWNTRVVIVAGLSRAKGGPYRFLRHPNYLAVIAEGAALPLVHDAWITAIAFTVLNAGLLKVRIRTENEALLVLDA